MGDAAATFSADGMVGTTSDAGTTAGAGSGGTGGVAGIGGATAVAGAAGITVGPQPGRLVAHYKFDETPTATALVDVAGAVPDNAELLQSNPMTGYRAGRNSAAGGSFWLNAWPTDPYFRAPASTDFNSIRTAVTVMAWVNMGGSGWRVIAERPRGLEPAWGLYVSYLDEVEFVAGSTPYYHLFGKGHKVPIGAWVHLAASYDTATGIAKVYLNGNLEASTTFDYGTLFAFDPGPGGSHEPFLIGRAACRDCSRTMTGAIDDLRVYNVALSDEEVEQIATDD